MPGSPRAPSLVIYVIEFDNMPWRANAGFQSRKISVTCLTITRLTSEVQALFAWSKPNPDNRA